LVGYYRNNAYLDSLSAPFIGDTRDANGNGIKDLYENLKKEYETYKFSQKVDANNKPYEYLAPVLGLYKNENETEKAIATLEVQIEVQEKPDELILEYDGRYFEITNYVAPNELVVIGKSSAPQANAPAPYVSPNPNMKKFKLARSVTGTGTFNTEDIQIECIAPFGSPQKITGGKFKCYYLSNTNQPAGWQDLSKYLYQKLKLQAGVKYDNYIRVFYLPAAGYAIDAMGQEYPSASDGTLGGYTDSTDQNIVMLSPTADTTSVVHEILHALKLPHTFESKNQRMAGVSYPAERNGKHSFKAKSTENIMDYGGKDKQYFLFNWQARIANGNAAAEPVNYVPETFTQTIAKPATP
jgi:hypothetical protein